MSFTINYKGTPCRGTLFLYRCPSCEMEKEVTHAASEEHHEMCLCNRAELVKKITVVNMDADHHESCKSHNLGWDGDEG